MDHDDYGARLSTLMYPFKVPTFPNSITPKSSLETLTVWGKSMQATTVPWDYRITYLSIVARKKSYPRKKD